MKKRIKLQRETLRELAGAVGGTDPALSGFSAHPAGLCPNHPHPDTATCSEP